MPPNKRTFIAIKIPLNEALTHVIGVLKNTLQVSKINWINDNSSHVTLHFLGNTSLEHIETVKKIIAEVSQNYLTTEIEINGLGIFKHNGRPSVIWAGIKKCDSIISIQNDLSEKLPEHGFTVERRAFKPHLTLGRIKNLADTLPLINTVNAYKNYQFGTAHISCIHYYESLLKPEGPEYKVLSTFKLL